MVTVVLKVVEAHVPFTLVKHPDCTTVDVVGAPVTTFRLVLVDIDPNVLVTVSKSVCVGICAHDAIRTVGNVRCKFVGDRNQEESEGRRI